MRLTTPAPTACAIAALTVSSVASAGALTTFDFMLDGMQEATPNMSIATGNASLVFDDTTDTFDLSITTMGIDLGDLLGVGPNSTPIHIHDAPAGGSGAIVIDLGTIASFVDEGGGVLSFNVTGVPIGGNRQALFNEGLYVNVHTSDFPGGEIRGQIVPTPGGAALLALGSVMTTRRRRSAD